MTRYSFLIQYQGRNYAGSQIQLDENGNEQPTPTIQGELERAICTLTGVQKTPNNPRPIKTVFSGRTDAGVNSQGQAVHFDFDKTIVASKFIRSINGLLPNDISISDLQKVESSFHAQKSAKKRYYQYKLINRKQRNAFDGDLMRVKYPVDINRMQKSLNYLLGEHDFSSFKSSGTLNPSKVCTLTKAECYRTGGDRVVIDIEGNRFLYNMVRTIVGTLLYIEGHNLPAEHMKDVLETKDRTKAGQTVSPYGLTLMEVKYN